MNVRGLIITIASIFVLSLIAAVALFFIDNRQLSERELAGRYVVELDYFQQGLLGLNSPYPLTIRPDGTVIIEHPVGKAEGRLYIHGRKVEISFQQVDGMPIEQWKAKGWSQARDAAIMALIKPGKPAVPLLGPDLGLGSKKSLLEAVKHLKATYPSAVADPYGRPWSYKIKSGGTWEIEEGPQIHR